MEQASQEDMANHRIDICWRDICAKDLIPLNVCRRDNYYLPFTCENEKHKYEKCLYDDYKNRVKQNKSS